MAILARAYPGVSWRTMNIDEVFRGLSSLGAHVLPRAVTFSLNGVAMDAHRRWKRIMPVAIDEPVRFTRTGSEVIMASLKPYARKSFMGNSKGDVSAALKIIDDEDRDRTAYLAFGFGQKSVRLPGNVGPDSEHIYIPIWRNLSKSEPGIKPVGGANGGLPFKTLQRLFREARGVRNYKRGARTDGGLFIGKPKPSLGLGIWARPKRHWDKATGRMVNEGSPRMLIRMADRAVYRPLILRHWNTAVFNAQEKLPDRLRRELEREIRYATLESA